MGCCRVLRWGMIGLKIQAMNKEKQQRPQILTEAKQMLASSVGRMPTALVVLLVLSLAVASASGLVLKIAKDYQAHSRSDFMPLRLDVDEKSSPIPLKELQGQWVSQTGNYAMLLTVIGDRFEWIIKLGDINEAQFYARGNYRVEGNVMVLFQRPDLGIPYDRDRLWIKSIPFAMKNVNTYISLEKGMMEWTIPADEQRNISSHEAEIFRNNPQGNFEWVKR